MIRTWMLGTGVLLLSGQLAGAAETPGGATVRAVVGAVTVIHDGSGSPQLVAAGAKLRNADRLQGLAADSGAQIDCANGATQTFTGEFDAILNPSGSQTPCAVDLNAGTAIATTAHIANGDSEPGSASISSGAVAMTAVHTQFGLEVIASGGAAKAVERQTNGFVLDGSAACRDAAGGRLWTLEAGNQIDVRSRKISAVAETRYVRLATAFAKLDLSQMRAPSVSPEAQTALQARWLAVMQKPQDAAARVNLAEAQASLKVASHISVYQVQRATVLVKETPDQSLQDRLAKMNPRAQFETHPDRVEVYNTPPK